MLFDKIPPQSIEAEQATIGALLISKEALYEIVDILFPEDFYKESHKKIYNTIIDLFREDRAVDLITVSEKLKEDKILEEVGGISYLTELVNSVPSAGNVVYYAKVVEKKAILRSLIQAATSIASIVYNNENEEIMDIIDKSERLIFDISERRSRGYILSLKELVGKTVNELEKQYNTGEFVMGIPTGFTKFDEMTTGFHPSDFIIIAGRPGIGKTAFTLNIAQYLGVAKKQPVLFFSLEMSKEQIIERMLCSEARINAQRLRRRHLRDTDWPRLTLAAGRLVDAPIYIDDTPGLSVLEIKVKARRAKIKYDIGAVFIDYLQLMNSSTRRRENRQQEISEISRSLKGLARELGIPVIAASQLSRAVEMRENKRPQLSDLRESGAIEQDADLVVFIYRQAYYDKLKKRNNRPEFNEIANVAEIIIGKQRNGPTGSFELSFREEYGRFENLAKFSPEE